MDLMKQLVLLVILIGLISGCYYDVEEDIYGTTECKSTDMSYMNDIFPIIKNNCFNGCHNGANPSSGISLESYEGLKNKVDDERLLGAIKRLGGFSPMPKDRSKLIACDIEKIENWILEGALNN